MQRREYLTSIGAISSTGLAEYTNSEMSSSDGYGPAQQQQRSDDSVVQFDGLNETAVFSEGADGRLEFTPVVARMQDYIVSATSGRLSTAGPENAGHTILLIGVVVENTGSVPVNAPGETYFVLDGQQYESSYITGAENRYDDYHEVQPDSWTSGWIRFEIPPSDDDGRLIVRASSFREFHRAAWTVDLSSLERTTFDYTGNEPGERVEWGTENTNYRIGVTDAERSSGYAYSINGYSFEETPSPENVFALVGVSVENTGQTQVNIPSRYDMSLIADSFQIDAERYSGDDAYEGGTISPGLTREGIVQFEVPKPASDCTFQITLTDNLRATWEFSSS